MMKKKSAHPIDKHVGAQIRMRRMIISMSQVKLAQKLGVTFQQVQKYEKGTNRVGAGRLQHIASVFGVPISFFFEEAPGRAKFGNPDDGAYVTEFFSQADGRALVKAFSRVASPKVRRCIVQVVQAIATER